VAGEPKRRRQFSSMLVLVGRVTSATSFDPTYAAIVQNKDLRQKTGTLGNQQRKREKKTRRKQAKT